MYYATVSVSSLKAKSPHCKHPEHLTGNLYHVICNSIILLNDLLKLLNKNNTRADFDQSKNYYNKYDLYYFFANNITFNW